MTIKVCKNHKNKTYKGDENTPLGKGYHAEGEKIDKKMKGKDGHMYKVIKTKSGKRWLKVNNKKLSSPKRRTKRGMGEFYNPYLVRHSEWNQDEQLSQESKQETGNFLKDERQSSPDDCSFLAYNLGNPSVEEPDPRDVEIMRNFVNSLNIGCSDENKEKLIRQLAIQYRDNVDGPRRSIDKLLSVSK